MDEPVKENEVAYRLNVKRHKADGRAEVTFIEYNRETFLIGFPEISGKYSEMERILGLSLWGN